MLCGSTRGETRGATGGHPRNAQPARALAPPRGTLHDAADGLIACIQCVTLFLGRLLRFVAVAVVVFERSLIWVTLFSAASMFEGVPPEESDNCNAK